jgi:hypothetical protein
MKKAFGPAKRAASEMDIPAELVREFEAMV